MAIVRAEEVKILKQARANAHLIILRKCHPEDKIPLCCGGERTCVCLFSQWNSGKLKVHEPLVSHILQLLSP